MIWNIKLRYVMNFPGIESQVDKIIIKSFQSPIRSVLQSPFHTNWHKMRIHSDACCSQVKGMNGKQRAYFSSPIIAYNLKQEMHHPVRTISLYKKLCNNLKFNLKKNKFMNNSQTMLYIIKSCNLCSSHIKLKSQCAKKFIIFDKQRSKLIFC